MISTSYSTFCLRIFGWIFQNYKKDELEQKNLIFVKANIPMSYEEYYSMTLMNTILAFIISLTIPIILYLIIPNTFTSLLIILVPLITIPSVAGAYFYYPSYLANKRGKDIDLFLPYAINFISSMAVAGISPSEIFQTLSRIAVYGEVQTEAKKIDKEIEIMGIDNITALKHAILYSPSRKFKSFLQGIIGTIQSGSDLHIFLSTIAKKYMDDDLITRKKDLDLLEVFAEVLVLAVIAFPIFLVIIVTVMGFFGGSMQVSLGLLLFFSFIVLPIIYASFYYLIRSTSIERLTKLTPDKKPTITDYLGQYKTSLYILILSICSIILLYGLIYLLDYLDYVNMTLYLLWDFAFLAVLILIGPVGLYSYYEMKKKKEMQNRLPDLLIEVGDNLATGMTIFDAVKTADKGNYGPLSPEVKKMKNQLSWNVAMKTVLYDFADRLKTAIVKRIVIVLDKGLVMGGNTGKIFKAAAGEVEQVNQLEFQRKSTMIVYALVMMVCFFVFLGIIVILYKTIFSVFLNIQAEQMAGAPAVLKITSVDPLYLKYTLYSFVYVQSICAGLLGGFMIDGKISSGVRFSCILGIIAIFTFKLII
jgi:flagellar protein FlaJ